MAVDPVVQDFIARSMAENNRSLMSEISTLITNSVDSIKRSNSEAVEDQLREIKKIRREEPKFLLCNDGMHLNSFVKHWLCLPKRPVAGRAKNKLFGTKAFKSPCLALRIDFLKPERLSPVGFCTSPLGHCSVCQP